MMDCTVTLAFILYKYFPFGGLQRDFIRIASLCREKGYRIVVYTMSWEGSVPEGFNVMVHRPKAISAFSRNSKFHDWVMKSIGKQPVSLIIGFNKMPRLDVYYAADSCYAHKVQTLRGRIYRKGKRCKHFSSYEKAVFASNQSTQILLISEIQKTLFKQYYGTQESRMHLLPPGISIDRKRPSNAKKIREQFRLKYGVESHERLLLLLGSGFITKGVDRALLALRALPEYFRKDTHLFIVGKDNPRNFKRQAKQLGIGMQVRFFPGLNDVPSLLQGADALIHPAYNENTGTVLLESLVAGLPVLCTDVCGYAHYIKEANAGLIAHTPFNQATFNAQVVEMLTSDKRDQWVDNAIRFSETVDLYSMPEKAANLIEIEVEKHTL